MEKFTKGPWQVVQGHYPSMKEIIGPSFTINCVMWATNLTESDYIRRSADLGLIAAAPEMYELLVKLSGMLTDINAHAVVNEIEKLLAKARGE